MFLSSKALLLYEDMPMIKPNSLRHFLAELSDLASYNTGLIPHYASQSIDLLLNLKVFVKDHGFTLQRPFMRLRGTDFCARVDGGSLSGPCSVYKALQQTV